MQDPYSVLGVGKSADQDTIRKAFKNLARKFHPDKNQEVGAEDRFKEVNAAHDILGDEDKRKLWDEFGEMSTKPGFDANQARAWSRMGGGGGGGRGRNPFGGGGGFGFGGGGGGDMEDLLGSLFGGGGARRQSRRGRDQQASMLVEPMMSFIGGETTISLGRPGGASESLKVRIPPGVKDGGSLRLKGQGLPPPGGGPCGDLLIKLQIKEHPLFKRAGSNLTMEVPITILEAVRGASITVPTPTGEVKVNVPAGVKSGMKLRVRGKGIQKKGKEGDLFLVLRPSVPKSDSPEVLAAAEVLEEAYTEDIRADLTVGTD